jgi:hypothetical protein
MKPRTAIKSFLAASFWGAATARLLARESFGALSVIRRGNLGGHLAGRVAGEPARRDKRAITT